MHDYIGDEVRELARIQGQIRTQVMVLSIVIAAGVAVLVMLIVLYSVRVARRITGPISVLSRKAQQFGSGDFTPTPVETHITELQTLDSGFDEMARRVDALMEKQMQDQQSLHRAELELLQAQINPHFLFNSLNILDFLVQEGEKERAGAFIRKLADCYRYMLKTEDESVVSLRDELDFAHKYSDLLSERFDQGLIIHYEIGEEALSRLVVPCCLQLLIENATKHNVVNAEKPLTVRIGIEGNMLYVSNNLQPRLSTQASTGKGLKNIRQQYLDISTRDIAIDENETTFTVTIPLL